MAQDSRTYVFFKQGPEDLTLTIELPLESGELIDSVVLGTVTPAVAPVLVAAVVSGPGSATLELTAGSGASEVTYGVPITVTTTLPRTLVVTAAVTVGSQSFAPYRTQDPESYSDLVGALEAGQSALSTCVFVLPSELDPRGGSITWEVLDSDGVVYAAGNAFEYVIQDNGLSKIVTGRSVVTVPSDTPPTLDRPYQVRYSLSLDADSGDQNTFYLYETLVVTGLDVVPLGTYPSVEMQGDDAQVSIVLDKAYDQVFVELYRDNTLVFKGQVKEALRVSSGYRYAGSFDTTTLPVSLIPYRVIWKYGLTGGPTFRESTSLWVVNPSILSAIEDCTAKINKARTTLYGTPDHQFPAETVMLWLRRAADAFNGAYGNFTSFTFTNAKGVIREFWLLYAEMFSIESQYLAEGEKAFNFQGAAIQLDVDRTQYLDAAASKIQQRLDSEVKPLKQNLIMKGCVAGDGSVDPYRLQKGAIGAVGITVSQASPWSGFRPITPFH